MSQENVETVASIYSEQRDYVAMAKPEAITVLDAELRPLYDPEYEFHTVIDGHRTVHRGFDGYLEFMRDWLAPWKSYEIAADEVRQIEPDRVAVMTRHRGRLKAGEEVRALGVDLWTLRDGRFLRLEAYMDREAGLEAAGLRE